MTLKTALLLAGSLTASVMGAALQGREECGAPEPTEEQKAITQQLLFNETMLADSEFAAKANVNVPVYVHIVAKDKTPGGGWAKVSCRTVFCMQQVLSTVKIGTRCAQHHFRHEQALLQDGISVHHQED